MSKLNITMIVAHDNNLAIGKDGQLPWHLPNDLKWFKAKTINNPIVMGRTTFEAIGAKPLPRRLNLVMTSNKNYHAKNSVVCHSLFDVLTITTAKNSPELFVIGGGEIYELFYPIADKLIITKVDTEIKGADTHFPRYPEKYWHQTFSEQHFKDEKHAYDYKFTVYNRIIKE